MLKLTSCPTCGSPRIRRIRRTLTRSSQGREFTVPNVTFHECPDCGEQVFSPEAMDKIESHRPKRGREAA